MTERKTFKREQLIEALGVEAVRKLETKLTLNRSLQTPQLHVLAAVVAILEGKRQARTNDYFGLGRTMFVFLNRTEQQRTRVEMLEWCKANIAMVQNQRINEVQG